MNDLNDNIYDWLDENLTTDIYYGKIPDDFDFSEGVISFARLSGLADQNTHVSNAIYQFSVRHVDIQAAYELKEELMELILKQGQSLTNPWLWFINSEVGELYEDDGRIIHLPITANLRYVRYYT